MVLKLEEVKNEWLKLGYSEEEANVLLGLSILYVEDVEVIDSKKISKILKKSFKKVQ